MRPFFIDTSHDALVVFSNVKNPFDFGGNENFNFWGNFLVKELDILVR